MRNTILKLLGISTLVIAGFFASTFGFQSISEKVLAKEVSTSDLSTGSTDDNSESVKDFEEWYEQLKSMTLRDYIEENLGFTPEITNEFESKFNLDTTKTTCGEITNEQNNYLYALKLLIDYPESPILTENEEIVDGQPKLNEQGEYNYSLQTLIMDPNAMTDKEKAAEIVISICQQYEIDPNGKVKDLNIDIINEIDAAIFEASDHDKS